MLYKYSPFSFICSWGFPHFDGLNDKEQVSELASVLVMQLFLKAIIAHPRLFVAVGVIVESSQ